MQIGCKYKRGGTEPPLVEKGDVPVSPGTNGTRMKGQPVAAGCDCCGTAASELASFIGSPGHANAADAPKTNNASTLRNFFTDHLLVELGQRIEITTILAQLGSGLCRRNGNLVSAE